MIHVVVMVISIQKNVECYKLARTNPIARISAGNLHVTMYTIQNENPNVERHVHLWHAL